MNFNKFEKHDWVITIIIFLLIIIGTLVIFSTTYNTDIAAQGAGTIPKQIVFIILGFAIYFGVAQLDISWLKQRTIIGIIYVITIGLLIYLKLFGEVISDTQRWIQVGFVSIQPSEIAKITIIILTSYVFGILSLKNKEELSWNENEELPDDKNKILVFFKNNYIVRQYLLSLALIAPILILVFIQPALGNTIILLLIWAMVVFIPFPHQLKLVAFLTLVVLLGGVFYNYIAFSPFLLAGRDMVLIILVILLTLASVFIIKLNYKFILTALTLALFIYPTLSFVWSNVLAEYHRERIEVYISGPEADQYGGGYQVIQSQIALGSGGLDGRGFLQGSQSALRVLDFAHTDFIYASLGEQFGFLGNALVLILYLILILRIISIAIQTKNVFDSLIVTGVAIMILLNVFINIGMNMGILPVTGVPLPLVSYGGSSIMVNLAGLGLVQAVKSNTRSIDISEKVLIVS